ncbi:hypothetical protein MBAV_003914 [Candidatus Magnetobacterium bavaricum]|uniref:Uncharacterized protein n=1 Tax=Candidatus Magnetobacterium bavaricum TaxID=29290 RepID=A0A0F3GPN2_9BACT|nr:hypothetical protein MBAV_003914 [Candidatus Magnetobacterium bavaricum]
MRHPRHKRGKALHFSFVSHAIETHYNDQENKGENRPPCFLFLGLLYVGAF